jgi:hypothetical protein
MKTTMERGGQAAWLATLFAALLGAVVPALSGAGRTGNAADDDLALQASAIGMLPITARTLLIEQGSHQSASAGWRAALAPTAGDHAAEVQGDPCVPAGA